MTFLVSGGSGFIGSAVVRALLARRATVRVLVRPTSKRTNLTGANVELVEGDLRDPASLVRAVKGCEGVFHVAADYRFWVPDVGALNETNVAGTRALLSAAADAGVRRVVYTSSVAALGGDPSGKPATEDTPVTEHDMSGHYSRSKFLAEREALAFAGQGLPVVIVNPSTPIGPRDIRPTPTGRIIVEAAAGRMPAFLDTGLNVVHVEDVAEGHWLAYERGVPGERYILGGDDLTFQEILALVSAAAGRRSPTLRLPHRVVLPMAYLAELGYRLRRPATAPMLTVDSVRMLKKHMFFSSAKARAGLGYAPRPSSEAIIDAIDWFRDNRYI